MNKQEIIQIVSDLSLSYHEKYKEWCLANPGYIMCNYAIQEQACNNCITMIENLSEDDDILSFLEKECDKLTNKYKTAIGMNGFYIHSKTYNEIIKLVSWIKNKLKR